MRNFIVVFLLIAAIAAATVNAHLCVLSPPQRGSMVGINKPAANDCILLDAPCGGRKRGTTLKIKAGSAFVVAFQKNLDHFNKDNPGQFNISVSFDQEKTFKPLTIIPDTPDPSLTLYYRNVTMPTGPVDTAGAFRVVYETRNPQAPPEFYQCGDIMLYN